MLRLLILTTVTSSLKKYSITTAATMAMRSVDFEVFGHVQGVFFRKHTKLQADKLGIKGWCMNTTDGTVCGQLEGPLDNLQSMMQWLRSTGSPTSKIQEATFKNEKEISNFTFKEFSIRIMLAKCELKNHMFTKAVVEYVITKSSPVIHAQWGSKLHHFETNNTLLPPADLGLRFRGDSMPLRQTALDFAPYTAQDLMKN